MAEYMNQSNSGMNDNNMNEWMNHVNKPVKISALNGATYEGILQHIDQENIHLLIPIHPGSNASEDDARTFGYGGTGYPGGYGSGYQGAGGYGVQGGFGGQGGYGAQGGYGTDAGYPGLPGLGGYGYGAQGGLGTGGFHGIGNNFGHPNGVGPGFGANPGYGFGPGFPGIYGNLTLPLAALTALSVI